MPFFIFLFLPLQDKFLLQRIKCLFKIKNLGLKLRLDTIFILQVWSLTNQFFSKTEFEIEARGEVEVVA